MIIIWFTYKDLVSMFMFLMLLSIILAIIARINNILTEIIIELLSHFTIVGMILYIFYRFVSQVLQSATDFIALAVIYAVFIFVIFLGNYHEIIISSEKREKYKYKYSIAQDIWLLSMLYNFALLVSLMGIAINKNVSARDLFTLWLTLIGRWGGAESGVGGVVSVLIIAVLLALAYVLLGAASKGLGRYVEDRAYYDEREGFMTCDRKLLTSPKHKRTKVAFRNIKLCKLARIIMALDSLHSGRRTVSYVAIGDALKSLRTLFGRGSRAGGVWYARRRSWRRYEEDYMPLLFSLWGLPLAYALPFMVIGIMTFFSLVPELVSLLVVGDWRTLGLYWGILSSSAPLLLWIVVSCLFVWLYMKWFIGYYYWHKLSNIEEVIRFFRRLLQSIIYYVARSIDRPLRLVLVGEYGGVERIGRAALRGVEAYVCEIQPR